VTLGANYLTTVCTGPASVSVEAATAALPRTGSNETKPFVLVGATILIVGVALVLAARRRERTHGRV
jgi:LPXTG-motif cell wall-anchored protein